MLNCSAVLNHKCIPKHVIFGRHFTRTFPYLNNFVGIYEIEFYCIAMKRKVSKPSVNVRLCNIIEFKFVKMHERIHLENYDSQNVV